MIKIKKSRLFNNEKIKFEINDAYNNIDKACKARLDLFNLPSVKNYNKILYLDTDILVKDDINKVFNVCEEDILLHRVQTVTFHHLSSYNEYHQTSNTYSGVTCGNVPDEIIVYSILPYALNKLLMICL